MELSGSGGLLRRLLFIGGAKANKVLDRLEDPAATLDYSYEKLLGLRTKTRRALVDATAGRVGLDQQIAKLEGQRTRLHGQAQQALGLGREDLARAALERRAALASDIAPIVEQRDGLLPNEEAMKRAMKTLDTRIATFGVKKETTKAMYAAAQAQTRANEAVAGIGGEFEELGMAVQRAEDKTATMQARAGATSELLDSGALPDFIGGSDPLTREIDALTSTMSVDQEIAAMRASLGLAGATDTAVPALGAAPTAAAPLFDATLGQATAQAEPIYRTA